MNLSPGDCFAIAAIIMFAGIMVFPDSEVLLGGTGIALLFSSVAVYSFEQRWRKRK